MNKTEYWENPQLDYEPPEFKSMTHSNFELFYIDDFLDNPHQAREQILNLDFQAPLDPKNGVVSFNGHIPENLLAEMKPKIEKALSKRIDFHPRSKCALTFEKHPHPHVCHVDGGNNMSRFNWTVIVYLNEPEQCNGGTNFFKHIPTGHIYNKEGINRYFQDYSDKTKWEMIEQVDMKFNRVLFCPAWLFHSLAFTFGETKENARMTLNPKVIAYDI